MCSKGHDYRDVTVEIFPKDVLEWFLNCRDIEMGVEGDTKARESGCVSSELPAQSIKVYLVCQSSLGTRLVRP